MPSTDLLTFFSKCLDAVDQIDDERIRIGAFQIVRFLAILDETEIDPALDFMGENPGVTLGQVANHLGYFEVVD